MFSFEHRREPLLTRTEYIVRLFRHGVAAIAIVLGALGIGIIGYHLLVGLGWIDSIVNAAMILGGMGPVADLDTHSGVSDAGKLFAAAYALFSGLIFVVAVGVSFAPAIHRLMHRFHLEMDDDVAGGEDR